MNDNHKEAAIMFDSLKKYQKEKRVLWANNQKIIITDVRDTMNIDVTLVNESCTYKAYHNFIKTLYHSINHNDPIFYNLNFCMQDLYKKNTQSSL